MCRFRGRKLFEHKVSCNINSDMSADRTQKQTRDTRSHEFAALVHRRRTSRREDHDCWDVVKCNERLTGAGSQFPRIEDCFSIITVI